MKLLDAVIGGEGMALIYDSVKVKDGKLATNLLELVVGILLTSIGGVMMGVRSIDPGTEIMWIHIQVLLMIIAPMKHF